MDTIDIDTQAITNRIEELENLLTRENNALSGPPTERLSEIARQKEHVIAQLSDLTQHAAIAGDLNAEMVASLQRCHTLNEENNILVNQRLKIVRDANALFRSQAGNLSVTLYDQVGRMVQTTSSNTLSEV